MPRDQGLPNDPSTRQTGAAGATPSMRETIQDKAGQVADTMKSTAGQILSSAQEAAAPVTSATGEKADAIMEQASEQVSSRLDFGKEYAADTVTGVAQALRQTGQHLRTDGSQPMLADYAEQGAEQLERFGGYLRHHSSNDLLDDVERFARRSPMVFAGGAFALGLLAARFLRASGSRRVTGSPSYGAGIPGAGSEPGASGPMGASATGRIGAPHSSAAAMTESTRPGPTPTPPANQPPSYANVPPASRTYPASPGNMPSPAGTGSRAGITSTPGMAPSSAEIGGAGTGAASQSPSMRSGETAVPHDSGLGMRPASGSGLGLSGSDDDTDDRTSDPGRFGQGTHRQP